MPAIPRPLLGRGEAYRQQVQKPRGGREPDPRRTVAEAQDLLGSQLLRAGRQVAELPDEQRGERVVVEATMSPRFIANSYYPDKAFGESDLRFVGTRSTPAAEGVTKTVLLAGTEHSLEAMYRVLYEPGQALAAAQRQMLRIDAVGVPDADTALRVHPESAVRVADGRLAADAVLHPPVSRGGHRTSSARTIVVQRFARWVEQHGGEVLSDQIRVVGGLIFVPVLSPEKSCRAIATFNGLRVLRDLAPMSELPLAGATRALTPGVDPAPPVEDTPSLPVRICVFDGPVEAKHPYLERFVEVHDLAAPPSQDGAFAFHGTWVTGAALHGPMVPVPALPRPPAAVDHVVIAPREGDPAHMPWALQQIASVVRSRRPKIVSISVAPAQHVEDDDEPHDWTIALDQLAHELDVLFVVAVGNCQDGTLRRIQVPADMVNGLAIGACDQRHPYSPWSRAPYSHVGPGRAGGRIRPSGVAFGGTGATPFYVAHPGAEVAHGTGTSLSAPLVARSLAALAGRLGNRGSTTALRAFAAHFAEPHPDGTNDEVGHGRIPEDFEPLLACADNEVTVLYQDALARDEVVSIPVPMPSQAPTGMYELRWTLAFASPVAGEDAFEYTLAGIEPSLRPDALATTMRKAGVRKSESVHLQRDAAKIVQLQADGWRVTGVPRSRPMRPERHERLRRLDGKWESLVRGADRLRASSMNAPVLWLDYLARAEGDIWRGDDVPPLPFSLLVTVKGPSGSQIYDMVRSELNLLVDLPVDVAIDVEIPGS